MSYAQIDAEKVYNACCAWLIADQEKHDKWKREYIEEHCSKRRFFGLLPPRNPTEFLTEQERDIWSEINLRNSLQRAYPNTWIMELKDLAEIAIKTRQQNVSVKQDVAKYLVKYF